MSEHAFACECGRAVQAAFVEGVLPGGRMKMGKSVIVNYRCECSPQQDRVRRYYAMPDAIDRITGGQGLPFRNPCPLIPVRADHPFLKEWRGFINEHGYDVGAFLLALNG